MSDWHIGVVETTNENNIIPCLVSYDEMQNWEKNEPTKWNLLQKISCQDAKGLDCYPTANQFTFGPTPDGNVIKNTRIEDDNCVITNPETTDTINIGPPDSSGKCTLNVFYCDGHGTCDDDSNKCNCIAGYNNKNNKGQGSNMCVLSNDCPFDPTAKEYGCASNITLINEDGSKYVNYKLGECDGNSCTCYDPKDNVNTKTGAWDQVDNGAGYKQLGVDITDQTAPVISNIPQCSICSLDYEKTNHYYEYSSFPGLNLKTCSNGKNFGCCSGKCYEPPGLEGKGFVCGEKPSCPPCMCESPTIWPFSGCDISCGASCNGHCCAD